MGMALSIYILSAGNAFAYGDEDESVYEFLLDRSSSSASELKEQEAELIRAMRETKERASREEVTGLKDELKALELEKDFGSWVQRYVRGRLASKSDWETRATADKDVFQTAIAEAKTALAVEAPTEGIAKDLKDLKDGKTKELKTTEHKIKDYPFKVVQKLVVKKVKDGEHKVIVTQEVQLDDSISRSDWSRAMQRKFEDFTDTQMQEFLEKHVNKNLDTEAYEVGELEKMDEDGLAKAMKDFPEGLANKASRDVFGASRSSAMNDALNDRLDALGDKNDITSDIGELSAQVERETDTKGRAQERADLQAKYDIAKALRQNPELANNEDTCAVILKVIGEDRFKKLSPASRMECESFFKKRDAEIAEKRKEREAKGEVAKQDEQRNGAVHNNFMQLVQHCQARRQMMANQNTSRPIDKLIMPMYNALQARGAGCSFFGSFMGDLMSTGEGDDVEMAALFGADPMALASGMDDGAYQEKAKEHVERMAVPSAEGTKQLERQASCLAKMSSLAGMSLQGVAATSPQGLMHPELISDPKIKQMMKYNDASRALLAAVNEELTMRKSGGAGSLQALDNRAPAGQGVSRTSVPFRALNTSDSMAERGQPGRQNNIRRDSTRGAGAPRRSPPPNFLGQ